MLLKAKIIGIGAAGNKAAIKLKEKYPELAQDMVLINSTLKDIPEEYQEDAIQLDGAYRGCAKEREVASKMVYNTIFNKHLDYVEQDGESMVIIVTSSEGGTGSGGSTMIAKYISSVYKKPIHFFIFTGFEDDVRGLKNTVDLFKELSSDYIVEAISNKKFLEEADGNRLKAEELANEKFADNVNILLGGSINPSVQNIDESDLLKLTLTPGFMCIDRVDISKLKNMEDFNKRLTDALDETKSLLTEPTCKRMATIIDVKERRLDFVDHSFSVLKKRFGIPFESFRHIQSVHDPEYMDIIIAGLKMPIEDIEEVYQEFKKLTESVDVTKDEFFNTEFSTESTAFNTLANNAISQQDVEDARNSFFKDAPKEQPKQMTQEEIIQKRKEEFANDYEYSGAPIDVKQIL